MLSSQSHIRKYIKDRSQFFQKLKTSFISKTVSPIEFLTSKSSLSRYFNPRKMNYEVRKAFLFFIQKFNNFIQIMKNVLIKKNTAFSNLHTGRISNSKELIVFVFSLVFEELINPYALVTIAYQEVHQR